MPRSASPNLTPASPPSKSTRSKKLAPAKAAGTTSKKSPPTSAPSPAARPAKVAAPAVAEELQTDAHRVKRDKDSTKQTKRRKTLVRDSFTMPKTDFDLIDLLKRRALQGGRAAKKSELLRAGLHVLTALDDNKLLMALERLEPIKIGRPPKDH